MSRSRLTRLYFNKVLFTLEHGMSCSRSTRLYFNKVLCTGHESPDGRTDEKTDHLIEEVTSISNTTQEDLLRWADKIKGLFPAKAAQKNGAKPKFAIAEGSKMDGSSLEDNKKTEPCKQSNGYSTPKRDRAKKTEER